MQVKLMSVQSGATSRYIRYMLVLVIITSKLARLLCEQLFVTVKRVLQMCETRDEGDNEAFCEIKDLSEMYSHDYSSRYAST